MVALAQWIEVKQPDGVAENRVWDFLGEPPDRVRRTLVQVADCDREKALVGYDSCRGVSLAQSQDALQAFSDAVTEAVNLIENAVNKVGMERVGTVVNRMDIGTIGPEGGVALQPWEVTVGPTDAGLWGFGTDVLATTVYGRFQADKVTQSGFFRNERTGKTLLVPEAEYIEESIISLEIRADYDSDYNHFLATEAVGNYSYPLRPENQVGQSKIFNYNRLD